MQILDYGRPPAGSRLRRVLAVAVAGGCVGFLVVLLLKRPATAPVLLAVTISPPAPLITITLSTLPTTIGNGDLIASTFLVIREQNRVAQPVFVCPSTQPVFRAR
jgi:hypothetical protein